MINSTAVIIVTTIAITIFVTSYRKRIIYKMKVHSILIYNCTERQKMKKKIEIITIIRNE